MRWPRALVALIAGAALALPAEAATVEVTSGAVFIDRGSGYTSVVGSAPGNAGDTVMVMVGGSAQIVYDDGCRQAVDVGALVTISQTSPCAGADGPSNWEANVQATTGAPNYTLVIGTVVVAGGVGAAIALSGGGGGGDDKPASK